MKLRCIALHAVFCALIMAWSAPAAVPMARSWTPESKQLSSAMTDTDPFTYEFACHVTNHDPCDFGLEFPEPLRIGQVRVDYATLNWLAYQPAVDGQALQYWDGDGWRNVGGTLEIDYGRQAEFAPVHGSGTVRWTYRFTPLTTSRIRVLITRPENPDPGFRLVTVRRMEAGEGKPDGRPGSGLRIVGAAAARPGWLEPAANLAVPAAGAHFSAGNPAEVGWPRRLMLNSVRVSPPAPVSAVEWWDGAAWRPVETLQTLGPGDVRFLPLATSRLRVSATQPIQRIEARLDEHAARYFRDMESMRADTLGIRLRSQSRPDLRAMQALLLSLDFGKAAIGRPEDAHETIVLSSGAFLITEPAQTDPVKRALVKYDRWFAFALGEELHALGADWVRVQRRYVDGWLPAVVTSYDHKGLHYEERVHVTAPGDEPYGTVAEIEVSNPSPRPIRSLLTLATGRMLNSWGPTNKFTPFFQDIEPTGYTLADDPEHANSPASSAPARPEGRHGRTVQSAAGDVILFAQTPASWAGTSRENHLRYALALKPGEKRTFRFFVPDVAHAFKDLEALRNFDWAASFPRFREWWNRQVAAGMTVEVPEPQINDIARQLVAQSLITSLDGPEARYGAYQYETYYGIEEGWAAVALAQWGHSGSARKIADFMLSAENMKKGVAHHQYRNGLAPWYGISIYRLTGDRTWLESIAPVLQEAADWTLRVTSENKDPKFGGILPRFQYGGDISTPAYSFYSNATCWRGLNDTALAFRLLGRQDLADRYQREADRFRKRLWELADQVADRRRPPVFLPMAFDIGDRPDYRDREPTYDFLGLRTPRSNKWQFLGNYWNLFAPMLAEVKLFEPGDPRSRWVPEYMEARGGILAGLVRFDLGLDHVYGKGYYESTLERGRRDLFLTSLYGVLAHGMSQNLYSSPEVAGVFPLRVNNAANWREHNRTLWHWWFMWSEGYDGWQNYEGEPLAAGAGVALQMIRTALVREAIESPGQDALHLLDGAPRHWFEPGRKIVVRNAPTFYGTLTLTTEAAQQSIRAQVVRSPGFTARQTILRLASPSGAPLREVTVNGRPHGDFSGDEIRLPSGATVEVVAYF